MVVVTEQHKPNKTHILIFPFPAQGHMIPLLDFSHRLAVRGGGSISITVLVTPGNLHFLRRLLSSTAGEINPLVLPFPSHPSIPNGVENVKDLPPSGFTSMIHALRNLHAPLRSWISEHPSPPSAIVSDIFLGWTHRLGLRRFVFSPSAAITCCILNHLWLEMPTREKPGDDNEVLEFRKIPTSPKYPWWQVSTIYRGYVDGDPFWEFIRDTFRDNWASWGLVINSFSDIEGVYLEHLKRDMAYDRVWAVGPILPPPGHDNDRGGPTTLPIDHLMTWLDARDDGHVIYVCFGSQTVLTEAQVRALASGLEKSGTHFVWVIKDSACDTIPGGFEDRVTGRGLVIRGWAPQVAVLNHRAVGAFLTHCGWNSVLEAVASGVLMLTWPMQADQYTDANLVVDQLGVGVRVCEGADSVPDSDELARVLAESTTGKREEKERAKKLSRAALDAVGESGSSTKELDAFIEHVVSLGQAK
ncbi:PREDICTED: UDP-glycosyltransferase 89B1 [Tarenaya hassleriana]|uniref:UDP-glycosyltransferase 89B1 n=1 Tax=Tarenaya hassleriana TaxID=28532 RepID=UPI00053C09E8|nr:PREDICTED: UDP-glycosyltransferase 89B1 [Tarenaya hassleriana]